LRRDDLTDRLPVRNSSAWAGAFLQWRYRNSDVAIGLAHREFFAAICGAEPTSVNIVSMSSAHPGSTPSIP
jgi:hypothetical protein